MDLGWRPLEITPIFSFDQDWIVTLEPEPGSPTLIYPPDTVVYARIYADAKLSTLKAGHMSEWPGSINPLTQAVSFHTEAALVNLVDNKRYMRIMIIYPGTPVLDPFCWAKGQVERDD